MTKPRIRRLARVVIIAVVALVALAVVFTFVVRPALTGPITEVTFDQSKAVPDFDGSTYTITDPEQLAELSALIEKYNALPELVSLSGIVDAGNSCAGGTTTSATISFASGRTADLRLEQSCVDGTPYADFIDEATDLLTSWKHS